MIKTLNKWNKGKLLQLEKEHLKTPIANIIFNGTKTAFLLKSSKGKNIQPHHTNPHIIGSSSQCKRARKGNKRHTHWKGKNKIVPICT